MALVLVFAPTSRTQSISESLTQNAQLTNQTALPRPSPRSLTINTWDYFAGKQSQSFCLAGAGSLCLSNSEIAPGRQVDNRTDSVIGVTAKTAQGTIKYLKDGASGPGTPWLRCFGSAPGDCSGAASGLPQTATLPILPAAAVVSSRWTAGGYILPAAAGTYGTPIDPLSCVVLSASAGFYATGAGQLFLLDSYDFGGVIGVKRNVLVTEGVARATYSADPTKGVRLERYFFLPGYGHLREEGWVDTACMNGTSTADCSGNYTSGAPGTSSFTASFAVKLAPCEYCAPGATGARIVSQSVPATMLAGGSYDATVTVENTGGAIWTAGTGIKLGLQSSANDPSWHPARVELLPNEMIYPGQTKTFAISVTAPHNLGTYHLGWRMLQEDKQWFGAASDAVVTVREALN